MQNIISSFDRLPLLAKIILALPGVDVIWVVYRLLRSLSKENLVGVVLAILILVFGIPILWILDIVTIVSMGRVLWID